MKISTTEKSLSQAVAMCPDVAGKVIGLVLCGESSGALVEGPKGILYMVTNRETLMLDQREAHRRLAQSQKAKRTRTISDEESQRRRESMEYARGFRRKDG